MSVLTWLKLIDSCVSGKEKHSISVKNGKKKVKSSGKTSNTVPLNLFKLGVIILTVVPLTLYVLSGRRAQVSINSQVSSPQGEHLETEETEEYHSFLATTEQHFSEISLHEVPCHPKGYKKEAEVGVLPQRCGTMVTDELLNKTDVLKLRKMAMKIIDKIGDTNFHNRESINLKWVNLHNVFRKGPSAEVFSEKDFKLVAKAAEAARTAVSIAFGLPEEFVWFHGVCQFTRYHPVVPYREFRHVDKVRSPNLIVTSILWLSTVDEDFGGGRTEFLTGPGPEPFTPLLVEPKIGRFAAWTSSYENPHGVHEVLFGNRYALIFAFTVLQNVGHPNMDSFREWATTTDALK